MVIRAAELDADRSDHSRRAHVLVLTGYLAITLYILQDLWLRLPAQRLAIGGTDQFLMEWFLWRGPHAVLHGQNPLFTDLWDPPNGANLMANTAMLGIGLPLAPITVLFGSHVTLVVALTLGLAGSAAAWYWLFRRIVPGSTIAAAVAGGFCAFAPAMISHANGAHLNLVSTFVIPFIAANALRLAHPGRALRNGSALGLLIAYQVFVGEELLLLAAIGLALFCLAYAMVAPRAALTALPHMLKGLTVAAGLALVLLAYPLWWQFFGPQSYTHLPEGGKTVNDVLALTTLPSQSLLGDQAGTKPFIRFHNEENAFFGIPLLVVVAFGLWRLRQERLARVSAIVIVLSCLLSLGAMVRVNGRELFPGPWLPLGRLPVLDSLVVSRLAFIAIPFIALTLAMLIDRVRRESGAPELVRSGRFAALAIVAALLPIAPAPLPVIDRPPIPQFFTTGAWQQVIGAGDTVMTVPMTMPDGGLDTITWQIPTEGRFSLVGGYFVGPHGSDRTGYHFPVHTPTQKLINEIWRTGRTPPIGDREREQAREDLATLQVDVVVLDTKRGKATEAAQAIEQLLQAAPRAFDDVLVWKVNDPLGLTPLPAA